MNASPAVERSATARRAAAPPAGRWALCSAICLALMAAPGCGDEQTGTPAGSSGSTSGGGGGGAGNEITAGDTTVRVDTTTTEISVLRGDTVLLQFPADAFELGSVGALDDGTNYDPYRLYVPFPLYTAPEITWHQVSAVSIVAVTASSFDLALSFAPAKQATLRIEAAAPDRFKAVLLPAADGAQIAYMRLRPRVDSAEAFYGLGEYFDEVNHRGKVRAMQLEYDATLESSYNEAHVPVPFVIGTRGWGLFVESPYPGAFALATSEADRIEAAFGTGLGSKDGLTFHLFCAPHPLDVTRHYYDVTGYPRLPARWALGPWIWRDENDDQAQVESDLQTIRTLDLATTGYWIDRPYATAVNTFDFNAPQFPAPQAMIDLAHDLGFRMALWHTPYLDEGDPAAAMLLQHATDQGYYPPQTGLKLNNWGNPIDLTNPDAYTWWQGLIHSYTNMGIEGFKLDYAEDVVPGLTATRNVWRFADGSDERTMHAFFQRHYHRVYAETLPAEGGFLLCRSGTYGDQLNGSIIWPGDLDADFSHHGETVPETGGGSHVSVGGLPASVVAGLSLGPSGFPFYGSDTGGYRHSPPDKETFTRWFEQTSLSTVMQIGTSTNNVAWEFSAQTGFDDEMLGWYRSYTRLHLRLFPYEWTYAQNLLKDGRPIQRALGLAYPELGVHPSDTYLFGDHLLVAPVLARGQTSRDVPLPPGDWIDYWTGDIHTGGQTISVAAPLGTLPLFIQAGGIVPMLRPTIDTTAPVADPTQVDSFATTPGILYPRIAPGPASTFVVFDGTELHQETLAGSIVLSSKSGTEFVDGTMFEVIAAGGKPTSVMNGAVALTEQPSLAALEAAASGWAYDPAAGGTVWVKVGPGDQSVEIVLP